MDATSQLKNNLINRIKESKDFDFLNAIQRIFNTSENELPQLTIDQNKSISKGRKEITNGDFFENKEAL